MYNLKNEWEPTRQTKINKYMKCYKTDYICGDLRQLDLNFAFLLPLWAFFLKGVGVNMRLRGIKHA